MEKRGEGNIDRLVDRRIYIRLVGRKTALKKRLVEKINERGAWEKGDTRK